MLKNERAMKRRQPAIALACSFFACGLSACCSNGGTAGGDNPNGIWLDDATLPAIGGLVQSGLPRQVMVVGSGASIGDVDGDGDPDLVLARVSRDDFATGGPSELFLNGSRDGQVYFEANADFRELTLNHIVYSTAMADYDSDGDLDIFLGCAGYDLLLEGRNDGTFRDVTDRAGVRGPDGDLTTGGIFADYNNDGLLDLYAIDHAKKQRLYLNLGDKTFLDVSVLSGTDSLAKAHAAAAADYDADGRLDIYLASDTFSIDDGPPQLDSTLRDELYVEAEIDDTGIPHYLAKGMQYGLFKNRSSKGFASADFNDDGFLDVYITDAGQNEMYLWNNSAVRFDEATKAMQTELRYTGEGSDRVLSTNWGALPIDLDRDGAYELFVTNGSLLFTPGASDASRFQQLDRLLRQPSPGAPFEDITGAAGMPTTAATTEGQLLNGRGAFRGDFDGDGDDDLLIGAFNEPFRVWMNDTRNQGRYVRVRLKGTVSAPDPIGAMLVVQCDDGQQKIGWRVQGGHTYGTSDNIVEVGCGDAAPVSAEILWPSGVAQPLDGFADQELLVEEIQWLTIDSRVAGDGDPAPTLQYLPIDIGSGKDVQIIRSDGEPVEVRELTDVEAVYEARLPHPGYARRTTLTLIVDGETLPIRPMIDYR